MKDSEVYLRAAERIAKFNDYSCNVVGFVLQDAGIMGYFDYEHPVIKNYEKMMSDPKTRGSFLASVEHTGDAQNWRVLALCFMAAIAKSEGR